MACISNLFCCVSRTRQQNKSCSQPTQSVEYQSPAAPQMMVGPINSSLTGGPVNVAMDDRYYSHVPLPRYTPHPVEVHDEKPPAFEDVNALSNRQRRSEYPSDEKTPLDFEVNQARTRSAGDHSSEASSIFSFPSTFGNTSTATTETPPPPYSIRSSRPSSRRSFAISLSTSLTSVTQTSEPSTPIAQPPPVLYRDHNTTLSERPSIDQPPSWSAEQHPPFPPAYSRP